MADNYVVLISVGERFWTKLTVLSYLSLQHRLDVEIPKYKTIIFTDKPRQFKAYFSTWVEIITPDAARISNIPNLHSLKYDMLSDLVDQRPNANFLYVDSDCYFNKSPLSLLPKLVEGRRAIGRVDNVSTSSLIGLPAGDKQFLSEVRNHSNEVKGVDFFDDMFHYKEEMNSRLAQIQTFFDRHYYREIGELFTLVGLWTPDKWHLGEKELPQELL